MKKRIAILFHEAWQLNHAPFTINFLKREWELSGLDVVLVKGIKHGIPADVAVNQVDLTFTPDAYLDYLKKYPVVINGKLQSIFKTSFSKQLLKPDDDHEGKVIIKTNANFGGSPELRLAGIGTRIIHKIAGKLFWSKVMSIKSDSYLILESIRDVPESVWSNKHLIVEKFLPEQDKQGKYHLRAWSFLGNSGFHVLTTSNHPIVKGRRIINREIIPDPVPDELISSRCRLGIDYGRIDYAIVDNRAVIYDVNRTPTTSPKAAVVYAHKIKEMAMGIYDFLL